MVEGPKVRLKVPRFTALKGCLLLEVVQGPQLPELLGKQLTDVVFVGKELFLLFDEGKALRLHFGMDGSERITKVLRPAAELLPPRSRKQLRALLRFDNLCLYLFDSTLTLRTAAYVQKAMGRRDRDVMSELFSPQIVVSLLAADPRSLLEAVMVRWAYTTYTCTYKCTYKYIKTPPPIL
jgi:formamidopyrimidine-DNA glycosylase